MQKNSINISPIKQRILYYLDYKNITPYKLYKETSIARGILGKPGGISEENIAKFLLYCPDVSETWLLTGKGNMIKRAKADETNTTLTDPLPDLLPDPLIPCNMCRQKDELISSLREQIHDKQKLIEYLEEEHSTARHVQKRKASA